jgi:hypothetical protein
VARQEEPSAGQWPSSLVKIIWKSVNSAEGGTADAADHHKRPEPYNIMTGGHVKQNKRKKMEKSPALPDVRIFFLFWLLFPNEIIGLLFDR